MRSALRKSALLFLILALLVGIERLAHYLTDDFGYGSISSNLAYHPEWDIDISKEELSQVRNILDQPYTYLSSGSQSYVFVSSDQKYVLKFFKNKRWRLSPIIDALPLPPSLSAKKAHWKAKKKETVHATFGSCLISFKEFKEETGTLFVHLNKTPIDLTLTLKDRIGMKHKINLDDVEFVLQKRAIPTDDYLLSLKKEGKTKEAEKALASLLAFTTMRAEKGYSDKDPHPIRNFGFIDGAPLEIDIGGFHRDPKKDLTYYRTTELSRIEKKLLPWLEKNYPELLPETKNTLAALKQ
ncbi:MAG: hypothetical protein KDK71_03385 [Chlamydiia bacterium]|nr:hypothetical protein [Chlamydiia bacterium]